MVSSISSHLRSMSRYLDREAVDSLVGGYGSSGESSSEEPLFHSPYFGRKRGTKVLDSDSEQEEASKSPVRKKKMAIRNKFRESMKAIERESLSANKVSDPIVGGATNGLEVEKAAGGQQGGGEIGGGETGDGEIVQNEKNGDQIALLMEEVRTGNKMLVQLTNRVKKTEKRLKQVENQLRSSESCSSAGSTPKHSRKREVPDEVRVCIVDETGTYVIH